MDDEQVVRDYLLFVLAESGFNCVVFGDCGSALDYLSAAGDEVGLIVSDVGMPGMNGLEFLEKVRSGPNGIPFILLSADYDERLAMEFYRLGATDCLLKPVSDRALVAAVRKHFNANPQWDLDVISRQWEDLPDSTVSRPLRRIALLKRLFDVLGHRRLETMQHSQRVAAFSRLMGLGFGIRPLEMAQLETGALLHDVGKLAVPQNIIEKPGALTEEEWRVIRMHPGLGARLLSEIPDCTAECEIVLCHHERYDGLGYPNGLRGEQIPLGARIFSVADTLDAICSARPYRPASSLEVAQREIQGMSGTQFDPDVVRCFQQLRDSDLKEIQMRYAEPDSHQSLLALSAAISQLTPPHSQRSRTPDPPVPAAPGHIL